MQTNSSQLKAYLTQVHAALDSPVFSPGGDETYPWKSNFIQLIALVHSLLDIAEQAGKRIDFLEGVGVHGKLQDITSLIGWMHAQLPDLLAEKPDQLPSNRLNRYGNQGWGYFANECFFAVEFNNELGFFIDDQRVYLNRHIRRAITEVEHAFGLQQ